MTESVADYTFADAVRLRIRGPRRLVRHFDAEYGEAAAAPGPEPDVDVRIGFGLRADTFPGGLVISGGHKTARWRVALGDPGAVPLRAHVVLAGGPPSFALSLVQGYVVEALVALALARAGRVALPSAAFATADGATVLLGRSGAGKTTLITRALAAGRTVLSDDQVVLDAAASAWRYPRRLRFYPDIRETAPAAWARLPVRTRSALIARRWLRRGTRGYVSPSLAVPVAAVGRTVAPGPLTVRRLLVIGRGDRAEPFVLPRSPEWAVQQAGTVLSDQRARLASGLADGWAAAVLAVQEAERRTLAAALAGVPVTELVLPCGWDARRSLEVLEAAAGISPGSAPGLVAPPPTSAR